MQKIALLVVALLGVIMLPAGDLCKENVYHKRKDFNAGKRNPVLYRDSSRVLVQTAKGVQVSFIPPSSKSQWLRTIDSSAFLNCYPVDQSDEIRLRLKVQPMINLSSRKLSLVVNINSVDASTNIKSKIFSREITPVSIGKISYCEMPVGRFPVGSYKVSVTVSSNRKILGEISTEFSVNATLLSKITIDPGIKPIPPVVGQLQIRDFSLSRFGGTRFTSDKRIEHDFTFGNSDGTGKFDIFVSKQYPGPLLFMTDFHAPPKNPYPFSHFQALPGNAKDIEGRRGMWPSGFVFPSDNSQPISINSISTGWLSQKTRLKYPDSHILDITYSLASPGLMLETNAKSLQCFGGLETFGLGGPTGLAWQQGGINSHFLKGNTDTLHPEMSSNWILAWNNGSKGWDYFDLPWLIVFQNKPVTITRLSDGLKIDFAESVGRVWLVPLMGRNPVSLGFTANWAKKIPTDIVKKCNTLGRLMLSYPINANEYYRIDSSDQSITATIVYEFDNTKDAWKTRPLQAAFVPPTMSLSGAYGFPMSFRETLTDLHIPDAFGPTLVALNKNSITWKMTGVLDIITQDRNVKDINFKLPETKQALSVLRSEIDRLQKENDLTKHPWNTLQNAPPGEQPRTVFPLLLELYTSWPYMSPEQQATLGPNLDMEVQSIMMNPSLMPPYCAVNGLEVATPEIALRRIGTDHMAWTSVQLYTLWLRGKNHNSLDFSPAQEEFLQTLYNVLLMTSDFSMGGSWDTYAGVRLGGGIQESAFAMCGQIAWYRMMKNCNKPLQAKLGAYLAARQMPAIFAQFCGNRWVREYIYSVDLSSMPAYRNEQKYKWRHAELNELPGLSRSTIGGNFIFTLLLTGVPEITRFYNRFAKEDALYFLTHQLDTSQRESWYDTKLYPNFVMSFADYWLYIIGASRKKIYDEFVTEPKYRKQGYQQIGNARAVLESEGKIEYSQKILDCKIKAYRRSKPKGGKR